MDFASLKKNRSNQLEKLSQAADKLNAKGGQSTGADERYWKTTVDKADNGSAIIRFLPAPTNEDVPFVRYWDHGFKGDGGWYIEKSLTSIGKDDPLSEYNSKLWNSGIESDKEVARKQKRRLHYVSNIFVIKDPGNPDNEGKVFLYEYGKKIFDKINDMMHPQFEDEDAVNPFDFWEGANFRLRIRNVEGYRNYDKSDFDSVSPLNEDDSVMENIWKTQYPLAEILDESNFKSYEELSQRLAKVLGTVQPTTTAEDVVIDDSPVWTPPSAPQESVADSAPVVEVAAASAFDDDDDSLDFFKSLAED